MSEGFDDYAGDSAHECASRAIDSLDAPLPFGDWAELGRQILAEAARRAIADGASVRTCVGGRAALAWEDRA